MHLRVGLDNGKTNSFWHIDGPNLNNIISLKDYNPIVHRVVGPKLEHNVICLKGINPNKMIKQ